MPDRAQVWAEEHIFHPDWPPTYEEACAIPLVVALLEHYCRHPEAMRSRRVVPVRNVGARVEAAPRPARSVTRRPGRLWWLENDPDEPGDGAEQGDQGPPR